MRFVVVFAALLSCAAAQSAAGAWAYDRQEAWPGECRHGAKQSPINIRTEDVERVHMPELRFHYGSLAGPFNVTGTGKTVRIHGLESWPQRPYIDEGGLDGGYLLDEVHFHWHYEGWPASEHSVDGFHYPIEIHLVHRRKVEGREHIAVVAVFAQPDPTAKNSGLVDLFDMFQYMDAQFPAPPAEKSLVSGAEKLRPESILPADRARFYRYEGSLTTPNCDEIVTWTVMQAPLALDVKLAKQLLAVRMYKEAPFVHNQRRQQALNDRRIALRIADDEPLEPPCGAADCVFWKLATALLLAALLGTVALQTRRYLRDREAETQGMYSPRDIGDVKVPDGLCFERHHRPVV